MGNKELDGMMRKLMAKSQREIEKKHKKEDLVKEVMSKMSLFKFSEIEKGNEGKLSDEQIQNWREVLCGILGPMHL